MVKAQKLGLIGRCLLTGGIALSSVGLGGCNTLDAQQTSSLHGLMSFTQHGYWQNERNEAIRGAGRGSGRSQESSEINYDGIKTTEIWNIDTTDKEIEIIGWDSVIPYMLSRENNFPKNGFLVYHEIDDKPFNGHYQVKLIDGVFKTFRE